MEEVNNYDWLNLIPSGWVNIAHEMIEKCEAINPTYVVDDMKEKWGRLDTYSHCESWYENDEMITDLDESRSIHQIEEEYSIKASLTCCICGQPAVKYSTGWIVPWCDNCGKDEEKYYKRIMP